MERGLNQYPLSTHCGSSHGQLFSVLNQLKEQRIVVGPVSVYGNAVWPDAPHSIHAIADFGYRERPTLRRFPGNRFLMVGHTAH